jgi:hypothetical protein
MDELIKIHNPEFNEQEILHIKEMIDKDRKLKPIFNLKGLILGPFYLLYKKAYIEAFAVFIISLLILQMGFILHSFLILIIGVISPNILVGFFFYFMYSNKIDRDIESCGKPIDKNCLAQKGGNSFKGVIGVVVFIIFISWPVIYGAITKQDVTTKQNQYINKIEKVLK